MEYSTEVTEIGDALVALSPTEAGELLDYLKITYKLELPASMVQDIKLPEPPKKEKPPEQTEFTVILESYDQAKKVVLIKSFREITGMPLKESLAAVNAPPVKIKENVSKEEAAKIKGLFEELGGKITVQ